MDEFSIETRIRQVVYELSQPLMIRCNIIDINLVSDCLKQIDEQQLNIDSLKQQIRQQNESQQSNQFEAAKRYTQIDILLKQQRILELEIIKNQNQASQSSTQLKSKIELIEKEIEQQKSHSQFVINSQLKTQNDLDQLGKKQTEYSEIFNKKIDEFFKDYYTFFIDCRNQVSQIQKSEQFLLKDFQNQNLQLEQLGIHKDLQEKKLSSLAERVEWIINEMNHLVNEDYLQFTLDKEEKSRAEDNQLLKGTISNLQSQIEVYNLSIDERIKGLEMLELQNRQQADSFQQLLNNQTDNFQKHFNQISKELLDYNKTLNKIDEFQKKIQEKIPAIVNSHLAVFQANFSSQMNKLADQFHSLKATIAKEMSQEFNYKLDDIRSQLLNESLKQQSIKLAAFESQMLEQKKKQQKKDVELQVILSDNSLSQQEQLQNFIIEQIDIKLTNCLQIGQKVGRINSLSSKGGYNLTQVGQGENQELLDENLEDMKTSVKQMLLDMKDEMEQKLKEYETGYTAAMQNFDKNHYHVLKLKSDIFNDTEYLNNQIKILFREKDVINRKFQLLLQLFSGNTEIAQITAAYLLKQSKGPIKFTSVIGTVFELRNEVCNYRQLNYSIEDLLKKSLQSVIDCWDKSELLEVREYNPHWYFNKYIYKNLGGQSKTLDRSQDKTIILTTQTQADSEVYINRSGRQRNLSQRHSILMSLDSTRPKRVAANSVMKQSERDDSNERFPKVKK